jgi:hypothetical protein
MKPVFFLALMLLMACKSSSQSKVAKPSSASDFKDVEGYIHEFFDKYKNESSDKALDYIFSTNKLTDRNQVIYVKGKLDSVNLLWGKITGTTMIVEKDISKDLVLFSYLVKYENAPLRFTFIFYRPQDHWMLLKFNYDDSMINELEDSAKIFVIK